MKLIGLMLARNEEYIIGMSARVALEWVDHLVVVNHQSSDRTFEILKEIEAEPGHGCRITVIQTIDQGWPEMRHRQMALEVARKMEATHIAMIDADEVLTRNLWPEIRGHVERLGREEILFLSGYNLRGTPHRYHASGLWSNRKFSVAFQDSPDLGWFRDQFHHREPMGRRLSPVVPELEGGILHFWGACERRLIAKHALYKITERIQWPSKSIAEIDRQYNQAIYDPISLGGRNNWDFAEVPSAWHWYLEHVNWDLPVWQEAECKRLVEKFGWARFEGLDLFGLVEKPASKVVSMAESDTRPTFSLCHTTARLPDGWRESAKAWINGCDDPANLEYILSIDHGSDYPDLSEFEGRMRYFRVIENFGRKCTVDGWNTAVKASTGKFLINVADDFFPCEHWDTAILNAIPTMTGEYALDVATGGEPGLLPFSMLTRPLMDRLKREYGYDGFFYPGYTSVYSDTEYSEIVRQLKVLIDGRHLQFEHRHPLFGKAEMDEVYRHVNDAELYREGRALYERRLAEFQIRAHVGRPQGPVLAVVLPGETFSSEWVGSMMQLQAELIYSGWNFMPWFGHCTNVYQVRAALANSILHDAPVKPDFVLWVDDDNIMTAHHLATLFEDLKAHSELDGVVGWSWVQHDLQASRWRISCGTFNALNYPQALTYQELMAGDPVKRVEWTGFPAFLMRFQALEKAGVQAFTPILSEVHPWGFAGEDVSFSVRAQANGCKFAVDARVNVRHKKTFDAGPKESEIRRMMLVEDAKTA